MYVGFDGLCRNRCLFRRCYASMDQSETIEREVCRILKNQLSCLDCRCVRCLVTGADWQTGAVASTLPNSVDLNGSDRRKCRLAYEVA